MAIQDCPQKPPALHAISTGLIALVIIYYECSVRIPIKPSVPIIWVHILLKTVCFIKQGFIINEQIILCRNWEGLGREHILELEP